MAEQFTRNEQRATVTRTDDAYYVLNMDGREIGGTNRAALERYARANGFTPDYRDARTPDLRVRHGL